MASISCAGCDGSFPYDPARPIKKYHNVQCANRATQNRRSRTSKESHKAREKKLLEHEIEFVAIDGEGIDTVEYVPMWDDEESAFVDERVNTHHYILLSVGDKSLHNDGAVLKHSEIFRFLYDQFLERPKAAYVGFFLGYDFSQWLKTLYYTYGYSMFTREGIEKRRPRNSEMKYPWPVRVDKMWEIDILGMKRFKLRPQVAKKDWPACEVAHKTPEMIDECFSGQHKKHPYKWMYVCDTGSFFQSSLMTAIDPSKWKDKQGNSNAVVTPDEYAILETGKANRDKAKFDDNPCPFDPGFTNKESMIRYNLLENDVLARVMTVINKSFVADGIRLKNNQWFGPGQAAQAWLTLIGAPTGQQIREIVPQAALDAARDSYYGGWFETMLHGPIPGETYAYDINSAYPFIISQLPCLLHGVWKTGKRRPGKLKPGNLRLIYARVKGSDKYIGTMPHRNINGNISRPHVTVGWFWQDEIDASKNAGLIDTCAVREWIEYTPCACAPPIAAVADLYLKRLDVGKNTPWGKSKKLIYNSAYGKFAQSIGMPKFSNSIYASRIVSGCRRMILEAIGAHPHKSKAVAMVATDSVTFLTPHPTLEIDGETLGKWDLTTHQNLSLMMPGLYWDDQSRAAIEANELPKLKSRGVSPKYLAKFIDEIDDKWRKLTPQSDGYSADSAPSVKLRIDFSIISPKLAAHRGRWDTCGKILWDETRVLSADVRNKRVGLVPAIGTHSRLNRKGSIRSYPHDITDGREESYPYIKQFGDETVDDDKEMADLLTPDGTLMRSLHAVIPD